MVLVAAILLWPESPTSSSQDSPPVSATLQEIAPETSTIAPQLTRTEMEAVEEQYGASKQTETRDGFALLRTFVHDAQKRPVGEIPVQLWIHWPGFDPSPWLSATSEEDGIARIQVPLKFAEEEGLSLTLGFGFPNAKEDSVTISPTDIPSEPVPLALHGLGIVEVSLVAQDGSPWPHPVTISFHEAPKPRLPWGSKEEHPKPGAGTIEFETDGDGKARLLCKADDRKYEIGVFGSGYGTWERKAFAAPDHDGIRQVEVRLIEPLPLHRFLLVDAGGAPLTLQPWIGSMSRMTQFPDGGRQSQSSRVSGITDKHGIARFAYRKRKVEEPPTSRGLTVEVSLAEDAIALRGKLDLTSLSMDPAGGLGTLALAPIGILASGRVRDSAGKELDEVQILVSEDRGVPSGKPGMVTAWPLGVDVQWLPNGGFRIQGASPAENLRMRFSAIGHHDLEIPVVSGSQDLKIVLLPSLVVRGRVTGIRPKDHERARLLWIPPGSSASGNSMSGEVVSTKLDAEGNFLFSNLKDSYPGEVRVYLGNTEPELAKSTHVYPHRLDEEPDSRLLPLAVEPYHHYLIHLEDDEGKALNGVQYFLSNSFNNPGSSRSTVFAPRIETFSTHKELKLSAFHPGFRILRSRVTPGESTLQFEEPFYARLRLENQPEVPEGMKLEVKLLTGSGSGLLNHQTMTLPSLIPKILPAIGIPEAGRFRIMLNLKHGRHIEPVYYPDGSLFFLLDVRDEPNQEFEYTFPNAGIAEAAKILEAAE